MATEDSGVADGREGGGDEGANAAAGAADVAAWSAEIKRGKMEPSRRDG